MSSAGRWTPKGAVARSRRQIAGAVEKLKLVALEWGDVDQSIVSDAESLIDELEKFSQAIEADTTARLAAGEHVGI
jgi:hypothetical protein